MTESLTRRAGEPDAWLSDRGGLNWEVRLIAEEKYLQPFDVVDPFNDNRLEGFLCRKPDHRYGALHITRVNGRDASQVILATPKFPYPFDRQGKFRFPPVKSIRIYEKLDGTNILAYRYHDADGRGYTTYKLRLFPILRNGTWGPFLDMWREMLERYPRIPELASRHDLGGKNCCAFSFELYGTRNTHLIQYSVDLDCALLFVLFQEDGSLYHPEDVEDGAIPIAKFWGKITGGDPVDKYLGLRASMERNISKLDDGRLTGNEGTMWYVTDKDGRITAWKCKPETVESIHWATGISRRGVMATCWNVLETDELSRKTLLPLLLEEYTTREIESFEKIIGECITEVNNKLEFRRRVLDVYREIGISIEDRSACMREMSRHFPRNEMRSVYTVIKELV